MSSELAKALLEALKYVGSFILGVVTCAYYLSSVWINLRKQKLEEQRFQEEKLERDAAKQEQREEQNRLIAEPTREEVLKYSKEHLFSKATSVAWIPVVIWLLFAGLVTVVEPILSR